MIAPLRTAVERTVERTPSANSTNMIMALSGQPIGEPALGGGSGRNLAERKDWTREEDAQIIALVQRYGQKWRQIAVEMPGRSDDAVRNRWKRVKDEGSDEDSPTSKAARTGTASAPSRSHARVSTAGSYDDKPERVSWSRKEDELIVQLVGDLGNKWNVIALQLPGRTEHAIRNRYARLQSLARRGRPITFSSGKGLPIGIQLVPESTK